MNPSIPAPADAAFVRKLNEIFYDVEAEQYDERHPEVVEGDADWWSGRGAALIERLRTERAAGGAMRILDVGCGTGFVASLLSAHLADGDILVGVDQSEGMLRRARSKVGATGDRRCRLVRGDAANLQFRAHSFDLVTVNSFLHHVCDYRAVLREIDRVLRPGGYVVVAHEPNRLFFQSALTRTAAAAYKLIGLGMTVPPDLCDEINARMRAACLTPAAVGATEILRMVEYHSPVEQAPIAVDKDKGFSVQEFLEGELRGYALIELNEYSTFYHRPLLERHPWLMRLVKSGANLLKGKGNLFSAVLRKGTSHEGSPPPL